MNSFLLIVILAICGGSYYEYTVINNAKLVDDQQVADMQARLKLQTDLIKELTAGAAPTSPRAVDLLSQLNKLNSTAPLTSTAPSNPSVGTPTQSASDQSAVPAATQVASQPMPVPVPAPAPVTPSGPSNDLGTIVTIDARTFQNCQLLKVQNDGITFKHAEGITKVLFPLLPPDLQKRFGFDPHQPLLSADEVLHQEDMRRAAAQAAGN